MNRNTLLHRLAEIEEYLALSETHVSNQEALIAELDRDGHDTTEARNVLATLLETKELHACQRERAFEGAESGLPMIGSPEYGRKPT